MIRRCKFIEWGLVFTGFMIAASCNDSKGLHGDSDSFETAELEWRDERNSRMQSPKSWLTIAGLFWLDQGENSFGTDPGNDIRLPEDSAPPFAGKFILEREEIRVIASVDEAITYGDSLIGEMALESDTEGEPSVLKLNDLEMWVIERGGRFAIRLRDRNAPRYKKYKGLKFYPPREEYKLKAEFFPFLEPEKITLTTIVGTETEAVSPGYVKFRVKGKDLRLDALEAGTGRLFFIFKDRTSGSGTYGACRFMVAQILEDGTVDLNFNRAYNPPCAYTPYATCPLPPPQNDLPVRIEAGEKIYEKGH